MMVTFVSQCQKKALNRTRRVLDAFANRIGDNTWQTVITEDGLIAVKKLLRKTATKNTAVACHWIRSRARSELVWVVGNRRAFNEDGVVPVNRTQKSNLPNEWENNWHYLPAIKALVAVSALLHDWGKASALFQAKLKNSSKQNTKQNTKQSDPLRHEWVSCLLLTALVAMGKNTDEAWLECLAQGNWDEATLKKTLLEKNTQNKQGSNKPSSNHRPLKELPPIAQLVAWLVLTHHRLPGLKDKDNATGFGDTHAASLADVLARIDASWGYQNTDDDKRIQQCFDFPKGFMGDAQAWQKALKKWAARFLAALPLLQEALSNGASRLVLHHARLGLMLGDHFYSSCDQDPKWQTSIDLYANTQRSAEKGSTLKQKLDEHLVRVCEHSLDVVQSLSRFSQDMAVAQDVARLKKKSPKGYEWQDKAVAAIAALRSQHNGAQGHGWFIVNMASTGCGKTVANAKMMRALSHDANSLRFILALGLRTLTLQTGDEYRNTLGLEADELGVLIGSSAVAALHQENTQSSSEWSWEEEGSESAEDLLTEELDGYNESTEDYDIPPEAPTAEFLSALVPMGFSKNSAKVRAAKKNKAFLYKPVLACTIDHIMAATETTRGGRYILPCLRLLSSDVVIDEVDDFAPQDLVAIGRLIHLCGMLGRKVMVSSATIPPALAQGFFNAYQEGWRVHQQFKQAPTTVHAVWVDEAQTTTHSLDTKNTVAENNDQYKNAHQAFVSSRVTFLRTQPIKRKAEIVRCENLYQTRNLNPSEWEAAQAQYFASVQEQIMALHHQHHSIDPISKKRVSFGVVRVANIPPCVALTQYLLKADWPADTSPKLMAYHSRQVLLLRHVQEQHLDQILKRKESNVEETLAFKHPIVREHINGAAGCDVVFIVVATPVEEVGRDHDFDWAVVEPSSFRSIVQLAGRVKRHRNQEVGTANMAIMQYNLRAIKNDMDKYAAFIRPGFEHLSNSEKRLKVKNLDGLLSEAEIKHAITAIPRIQEPSNWRPTEQLADLEHQVLKESLTCYSAQGPKHLQAWLVEAWWLTALPQHFNRFRDGPPNTLLYYCWHEGKLSFYMKSERGHWVERQGMEGIEFCSELGELEQRRLWLPRNYETVMRQRCGIEPDERLDDEAMCKLEKNSKEFGEVAIEGFENNPNAVFWYSDDFGIFPKKND